MTGSDDRDSPHSCISLRAPDPGAALRSIAVSNAVRMSFVTGVISDATTGAGGMTEANVVAVSEIEATGAGDVFTTAYLVEYNRSRDIQNACVFAQCAASIIIEGEGIDQLPTEEEIEKRVVQYHKIYGL